MNKTDKSIYPIGCKVLAPVGNRVLHCTVIQHGGSDCLFVSWNRQPERQILVPIKELRLDHARI